MDLSKLNHLSILTFLLLLSQAFVDCADEEDISKLYQEICKIQHGEEYFRLAQGPESCQDVFSCSAGDHLNALRCPKGYSFDVERQLCEWSDHVANCDQSLRSRAPIPSLRTPCEDENRVACGDGTCLPREKFCDHFVDCEDGSDESLCDVGNDLNGAPNCEQQSCKLPDCFCSKTGTLPPQNLTSQEIPQIVTITFAGVINKKSFELFKTIFDPSRRNPNGCSLKGTFFVSHEFTNYSLVNELHRQGHEIAANTISHDNDANFWRHASKTIWTSESAGQRRILARFANIPIEDIKGFRSPLLRLGGNRQFGALQEAGFTYDSSMVVPGHDVPLYPYSLDAKIPHPCQGFEQDCPTRAFPKLWELPINQLVRRHNPKIRCSTIDNCGLEQASELYDLLAYNFMRHYHTNRAPLSIHLNANWIQQDPRRREAVLQWMDDVLTVHDDVHFVTVSDALDWMKSPKKVDAVNFFRDWYRGSCRWLYQMKPSNCENRRCVLRSLTYKPGENHVMDTCAKTCPKSYPWADDIEGERKFTF